MTKNYEDDIASGRAWNKLAILVRFRFAERVEEIEHLAEIAACEVSWTFVYDQEVAGKVISYAVVSSVRTR